ncbi:MAG: phytanoyl-CoA dioxygenase family protein [Pseudomonadota bacterium]
MLSEEQHQDFQKNGYLIVEDVLDQNRDLQPIRLEYASILDRLCRDWVAEGRLTPAALDADFDGRLRLSYAAGLDWFQPMDISLPGGVIDADTPMHFGPAVFDMVTHARILDIVEDLIGPEITSNPIQHVRIKPPADLLHGDEDRPHVTFTDWHQDQGVTHQEADETDMVTVWVAISDATEENGCLQFIPGSHAEPLKTHCPAGIQLQIPDAAMDKSKAVPAPMRAGGIAIFHPKTAHSSLVNRSEGFRWSFDLRYSVTGQPTGRAHFPEFTARSRKNPETVLTDHNEWRKMWERARARLAVQSHIPIHRWDPSAPACA